MGSFFSGVLFISDASEGEAKKDVAKRGATNQRIQIKWSPPRIIGSDMGTHAATSTRRATPKDPRSMKERAWASIEWRQKMRTKKLNTRGKYAGHCGKRGATATASVRTNHATGRRAVHLNISML